MDIEWAYLLTAVATESVAAHGDVGRQLAVAVFDSIVRNTPVALHGRDGLIGAGIEASGAVATLRLDGCVVGIGRTTGNQLADITKATQSGIDQQGVFAYPTQASLNCPEFVADGNSIDTRFGIESGKVVTQ